MKNTAILRFAGAFRTGETADPTFYIEPFDRDKSPGESGTGRSVKCHILWYIPIVGDNVKRTAKLFLNGRSQAVRLPSEFRFEGSEVFVERDPKTGNLILSRKPELSWQSFVALRDGTEVPDEFMPERGDGPPQERDLF